MKNDSPNAFKLWISPTLIDKIANAVAQNYSDFDRKQFVKIKQQLDNLELKPRVILVANQLQACLPREYCQALQVLVKAADQDLSGFDLWPFTYFVEKYGADHFDESMKALYKLTLKFTAEFAVRPFIHSDAKKTLALMLKWSKDSNVHVRRLASEGSRPRLPWGMRLANVIQDPQLTLPILEQLKYDEELYVRKSVANHLNDFAKDHADLVVQTLIRWQKECPQKHSDKISWIVRHASRTLIKNGHVGAMKLAGVNHKINVQVKNFSLDRAKAEIDQKVLMHLCLTSNDSKKQKIIIDYVIHYVKAGGKTSRKVFKWKVEQLGPKQCIEIKKYHHFKQVTTRKHYPGIHKIEVQINGKVFKQATVDLKIQK